MRVYEGKVEWRGENTKTGELKDLPIAISLEDFSMDLYPPKITIIDRTSGESFPVGRPEMVESFVGSSGVIGEWTILLEVGKFINIHMTTIWEEIRNILFLNWFGILGLFLYILEYL